ncbi:carboxymuconolactone decarboxylase family protein [Rhodoglobus aureus]|uniref:Carboxymuconolactone decarboxylase family protein n=1 Tax=Rhodoglobus aureus TaxID=191497 RepID=A0ABP4G7F2_9MICO
MSVEDIAAANTRLYAEGLVIRREVLGDAYVDKSLDRARGTDSEALQQHVTRTVWGSVWTRPGLDRRSRSLLNVGILTAMSQLHELSVHITGGLRNGLTREEIVEAIVQATAYSGAPLGLAAMRVAQDVFDAQNEAAQ